MVTLFREGSEWDIIRNGMDEGVEKLVVSRAYFLDIFNAQTIDTFIRLHEEYYLFQSPENFKSDTVVRLHPISHLL